MTSKVQSWVPKEPYDRPRFCLEIAEVIRNKSQNTSNGYNDRSYVHFNLNFQINIHRLGIWYELGPQMRNIWRIYLYCRSPGQFLYNWYSSNVSSLPELPSPSPLPSVLPMTGLPTSQSRRFFLVQKQIMPKLPAAYVPPTELYRPISSL